MQFKLNSLALLTSLICSPLISYAQDSTSYLFDYVVKNPKFDDSMPYDTIHGVITQGNKIIVPAEYTSITLRQNEGKTEILAFNKYGKYEDIIRRFDINGKALSSLSNINNYVEERAYAPPRYIVEFTPPPLSEAEKEKMLAGLEKKFKQERKNLNREEQRELAKDIVEQFTINYSYLTDMQTGEKVPLKGKDILRVNPTFTSNELHHQKLPAQSLSTHKWGYINPKAEWVIPPAYDGINNHYAGGQDIPVLRSINNPDILSIYTIGKENENYKGCQGLLNSQGNPTTAKFDSLGKFTNGFAITRPCGKDEGQQPYDVNGLIDNKGDWLIMPNPNLTILTTPDTQGNFFVKNLKTNLEGVMNIKGDWVIPAKYIFPNHNLAPKSHDQIANNLFDSQGLLAVLPTPKSLTYGFMNKSGQWQIPPTLPTTLSPDDESRDWLNKDINSYRFDTHGFAYGLWDKNCPDCRFVFNTKGERVLPQLDGYIGSFNPQGYAPFVAKGTNVMQIIDKTGKAITEPKFNNTIQYLYPYNTFSLADEKTKAEGRKNFIQRFSNDNDSLVGLMNYKGDIILPPEYKDIDPAEDEKASYAIVKTRNNKYGVIDFSKNWIIQPQYYPLKPIGAGVVLKNLEVNAGL